MEPLLVQPVPGQQPLDTDVPRVAPLPQADRLWSVDVLRGVALLGILLMNITGFGLPFAASFDPNVAGGATGSDLWVWAVNTALFEGKFRAIFSMLFGAGIIVLTSRLEERGAGAQAADICLRRLLWLVAFGLVHAFFVWWGDILFYYGVLGVFLYPFRKLSGRTLVVLSILALLVHCVRGQLNAWDTARARADAAAADAAQAAGAALSDEQKGAQEAWANRLREARPPAEEVEKEIAAYRGGYLDALRHRAGFVAAMQAPILYNFFVFDIGAMMLAGMGLFKLGFFSAASPTRVYSIVIAVGLGLGVPITAWVVRHDMATGFDPVATAQGMVIHAATRLPMALALAAIVMLVCRAGAMRWLTARLAAVGQLAFTNYLAQSLICTTVFYGYGFGLFGHLQRHQLYYVVGGVWMVQLIVSPVWLRHFRFGPLEWLWRSLTYVKTQPMRRQRAAMASAAEVG